MKRIDSYFDDFFVAIYDKYDNYIYSLDTIEDTAKFFDIRVKDVLRNLRDDRNFLYKNNFVKIFLIKKDKEIQCKKVSL